MTNSYKICCQDSSQMLTFTLVVRYFLLFLVGCERSGPKSKFSTFASKFALRLCIQDTGTGTCIVEAIVDRRVGLE